MHDCMGRKRALSRNLIELKADFRFEPHPLLIDESNLAEGSIAGEDGETKNVVEHLLAGCPKNSKAMKTFEAGAFVFRQRLRRRHLPTGGRRSTLRIPMRTLLGFATHSDTHCNDSKCLLCGCCRKRILCYENRTHTRKKQNRNLPL